MEKYSRLRLTLRCKGYTVRVRVPVHRSQSCYVYPVEVDAAVRDVLSDVTCQILGFWPQKKTPGAGEREHIHGEKEIRKARMYETEKKADRGAARHARCASLCAAPCAVCRLCDCAVSRVVLLCLSNPSSVENIRARPTPPCAVRAAQGRSPRMTHIMSP